MSTKSKVIKVFIYIFLVLLALPGSVDLGGNHLIEGRCGVDDFSVGTA